MIIITGTSSKMGIKIIEHYARDENILALYNNNKPTFKKKIFS